MPNNEGSAGAGRDGSRLWSVVLKIRKLRAQELEMKRFTRYQADQLMLLADELEALAVPDPLASDTGHGTLDEIARLVDAALTIRWQSTFCGACGITYSRCLNCSVGVRVKRETKDGQCGGHQNAPCDQYCIARSAIEATAALAAASVPLASSSAPQGENTKDETTTI